MFRCGRETFVGRTRSNDANTITEALESRRDAFEDERVIVNDEYFHQTCFPVQSFVTFRQRNVPSQ